VLFLITVTAILGLFMVAIFSLLIVCSCLGVFESYTDECAQKSAKSATYFASQGWQPPQPVHFWKAPFVLLLIIIECIATTYHFRDNCGQMGFWAVHLETPSNITCTFSKDACKCMANHNAKFDASLLAINLLNQFLRPNLKENFDPLPDRDIAPKMWEDTSKTCMLHHVKFHANQSSAAEKNVIGQTKRNGKLHTLLVLRMVSEKLTYLVAKFDAGSI